MRQHVITGEQQPVLLVEEDQVPLGVAGGGHRPQTSIDQLDLTRGGDPVVRFLPEVLPADRFPRGDQCV
ncbi:hypothetical protein LH612_33395, partial [Klebsiella pneumoniae]|nr:hypothetical protein [Klebsiella pneumoniae]